MLEYSNAARAVSPRFDGNDLCILCEGKSGSDHTRTNDERFVKRILKDVFNVGDGARVEVRSVGSRQDVMDEVEKLRAEESGVYYIGLCDADYEGLLGRVAANDFVVTTFGYSWENDLWYDAKALDLFDVGAFPKDTESLDTAYSEWCGELNEKYGCLLIHDIISFREEEVGYDKSSKPIEWCADKRWPLPKFDLGCCLHDEAVQEVCAKTDFLRSFHGKTVLKLRLEWVNFYYHETLKTKPPRDRNIFIAGRLSHTVVNNGSKMHEHYFEKIRSTLAGYGGRLMSCFGL